MKKLASIIVTLFFAASAPVASAADWKEEFVVELINITEESFAAMGEIALSDEEKNIFNLAMWDGVSAALRVICTESDRRLEIRVPFPDEVTTLQEKISGAVERREIPSKKDIHAYGVECLTHVEAEAEKKGISADKVEKLVYDVLIEVPAEDFQSQ